MKNKTTQKCFTALFLLLLFFKAEAQFEQKAKIVSDQREDRAEFGTAVAIKNNYAIVGAPRETIATGAVYLYEVNNEDWTLLQHITAPDGHQMAEFGGAVQLTDSHVVIASGRADTGGMLRTGALYVYEIAPDGSLGAPTKLVASDAVENGLLGMHPTTLAVQNTTIAVGSPGIDGWTGAVYLFELIEGVWTETQKLQSPTAQQFESFGISVSIDSDQLVIGANEANNSRGEVHVYQKNTAGIWEHRQVLTPSLSTPNNYFGTGASIYGNTIAAGAYGGSPAGGGESVFIFEKNISGDWEETQQLTGHTSTEETHYGWDCKIQDQQLIVSAPHIYGLDKGEVYLYHRDNNGLWTAAYPLSQLNNVERSFFGWNIALDHYQIVVGAPRDDFDENDENEMMDAGAVFFFQDPNLSVTSPDEFITSTTVYPVPAAQFVTINSTREALHTIILYTPFGQVLQSVTVSNKPVHQLDLSGIRDGVYFISVQTTDGKTTTHKIIKKK